MALQVFPSEKEGPLNRVLVTVISEVALVCATVLLLFGYLRLPIPVSTGASLAVFFAGTLLCWRSFTAAQVLLPASLLVSEFVLFGYFDWLLPAFLVVDVLAFFLLLRVWQPKDD